MKIIKWIKRKWMSVFLTITVCMDNGRNESFVVNLAPGDTATISDDNGVAIKIDR